jgi:dihydrofolate reductase
MRKIINSTFITLDGVVEEPNRWPSLGEDGEAESFAIHNELLQSCDVLLMGRRTYDGFVSAWPSRSGDPFSDRINSMEKCVVSSTLRNPAWSNTRVINRDAATEIKKLKEQPGRDILQYGLGDVSLMLIEHGLLDEIRLWVHPVMLGSQGPQVPHFRNWKPTLLHLVTTKTLPNGNVILNYKVGRSA